MKIIKVINNNTVCVIGKNGKEQIVSGKGIGFNKKYGDMVNPENIQKTYLITNSELQKRLIDLLEEIPYEYIKFTDDMVEYIKSRISSRLNESLLVTLSDHISFAIERQKQGIEITNPLMSSIKECYPQELELGNHCLKELEKKFEISLLPDEAGFIAMHIVNARFDIKISEAYEITKLVNSCVEIAEYYYSRKFEHDSPAYERFIVHLKYLAQRIFRNQPLPDTLSEDEKFIELIQLSCRKHYKCAIHIEEYILKTYSKSITEDEVITLTLHLKKISMEKQKS